MAIAYHIHFPQAEATINVLSPRPRGTIRVLSIVPRSGWLPLPEVEA